MAYAPKNSLVNATDLAVGTYRYAINTETYESFSIHSRLVSDNVNNTVTMTLRESNDESADNTADTGRVDFSTAVLGWASISVNNATSETIKFTSNIPEKFMIKLVVANTWVLWNEVFISTVMKG